VNPSRRAVAVVERLRGGAGRVVAELRDLRSPRRTVDAPTWRRGAPPPSAFRAHGDASWLVPPCTVDGAARVRVGRGVVLLEHARVTVADEGELRIGDGVRLGRFATIACASSVEVGDDVSGSDLVAITDADGPVPPRPGDPAPRPVVIGRGAYLGAGCVITAGVHVGDGAYVGEGAVVVDDVPPHALVRGNPARVVAP
jgi:acetyltransferase-like isoleucine patch superfamily enzyme